MANNKVMAILSGALLFFTAIGAGVAYKKGWLTNNEAVENQNTYQPLM